MVAFSNHTALWLPLATIRTAFLAIGLRFCKPPCTNGEALFGDAGVSPAMAFPKPQWGRNHVFLATHARRVSVSEPYPSPHWRGCRVAAGEVSPLRFALPPEGK